MAPATESGPKAVVLSEVDKAGMEDRVAVLVVTEPDRLDAVVENLLRHTAEVVEGLLVNLVIENFSVAHRILADHACQQVLAEGVELGADLPRLACCLCSFAQQPADGLAVAPSLTRNLAD